MTTVSCRVRCGRCQAVQTVDVATDAPVQLALASIVCGMCAGRGGFRLAARLLSPVFAEPARIGPHDAPPDDPDEADDVEQRRARRSGRTAAP